MLKRETASPQRDRSQIQNGKLLHAEARTAAAGALYLGVLKLEAGSLEGLYIVHRAAVQVHRAGRVDEDLEVLETNDLIHHAGGVLKRHGVLETGTSATDHTDAQTGRNRILGGHDLLHLCNGGRGQDNRVRRGGGVDDLRGYG